MPKVLSSWSMGNDGKLVENDLKLSYSEEDGSYTIESRHESIGIILGLDQISRKYTIITSIPDTQRMSRFKPFVNVGDILVAINDQIIVEETFKDVTQRLETLVKEGNSRKLTFLNRNKYSIDLFITKLQLNQQVQTDLLGFVCSPEDSIIEKQYQYLNSTYLQSRDLEWVNYLKSIGGIENLKPAGIFKPYKDLKFMVRKGIPVAYRASIWPKISLSSIYRLQFPKNYYEVLLQRAETELNPKVRVDIEKDVDRTFPEHRYFNPSGSGEDSLRRILHAFALHNPTIGYCQSLNFLAGMMLIFMSEEESFWLLLTVVEKLLPADYYTKSMVGTYVDQFVLAHVIKKYLPHIHKALDENQLQLPLITVQWFMCLFVNTLKPEVTLRIWDMFLNEGSKVLFRIAAALFKVHEKELLAVTDAGDLFTTLRKIGKDVVDADVLIAAAYKSYQPNNPSAKVLSSNSSNSSSSKTSPVKSTAQRLSVSAKLPANKPAPQNGAVPPSLNKPVYKASPSNNSFKKNPIFDISPRLQKQSDAGKVPNPLMGVGLAHVGPISERPEVVRYQSVTDIASHVWDLADGTIPFEIDQEMMTAANQMSDNLLSAEVYESKTTAIKEENSTEIQQNEENGSSKQNMSFRDDETVPSDLKVVDIEENIAQTEKKGDDMGDNFDQTLFSNPSLMLNRVRESQIGRSNVTFINAVSTSSGKPKRNRKFKIGEFTFTRADIAVWRSTFRPGLQDRYERMERARAEYVKEKEKAFAAPSLNKLQINSDSKDEEIKGEKNIKESITPISISSSRSPRFSNAGLSPQVRRSIDQASLSPLADPEIISTIASYDLDHQFENP